MRVNAARLADVIGVSTKTVTRWREEGMPRRSAGAAGMEDEYDTAEVIRWMIAREAGARDNDGNLINYEVERARLTKEQADKTAMANDLMRGRLVDAEQVGLWWASIITNAKTRLLAIPTKAAPLVVGSKSLPQVRDQLERMVNEVLNELCTADPIPAGDGAVGVEPAAAADGERVGRPASQAKSRKQRGAGAVGD